MALHPCATCGHEQSRHVEGAGKCWEPGCACDGFKSAEASMGPALNPVWIMSRLKAVEQVLEKQLGVKPGTIDGIQAELLKEINDLTKGN